MSTRQPGTRRRRVQVTVPVQVLEAARDRASSLGLTLSAYFSFLLARDHERTGSTATT